jgi:exodeoxyribonuclease V alpha subunit
MNVHEQFAVFFDDLCIQPYAYLISKKLSEGHICVELDEIILFYSFDQSRFEELNKFKNELLKIILARSIKI